MGVYKVLQECPIILQFKYLYMYFSFLALPYAYNGTGARHLPYFTDLNFYYNCRFASVFLLFVVYMYFSSFLTLPYALCGSIKLYTSVKSLECQELVISCCRAFRGIVWGYIVHKQICVGRKYIYYSISGYDCISICWYSLARYSKFVVYIALDLLPWAGFLF